jgi:hypothetical protein
MPNKSHLKKKIAWQGEYWIENFVILYRSHVNMLTISIFIPVWLRPGLMWTGPNSKFMRKIKIACMTNHYNYVYGSMLEKYRAVPVSNAIFVYRDLTWKAPFGEGAFFLQYLLKTKTLCILTDAFQQLLWSNIDTSQICWLQQWKLSLIFNGLHILSTSISNFRAIVSSALNQIRECLYLLTDLICGMSYKDTKMIVACPRFRSMSNNFDNDVRNLRFYSVFYAR